MGRSAKPTVWPILSVSGETGLCDALFDVVGECRDTIAVPRIHRIVPTEWKGKLTLGATEVRCAAVMASPRASWNLGALSVEVLGHSSSRPVACVADTLTCPTIDSGSVHEGASVKPVAWKGAPQDAFEAMRAMAPHSFPVLVEVRDMSQPRPYAPIMFAFGYPMFIGFGLTLGAFVLLFLWCGLRCHLVNINARENQGLPPMFYQGMRRFRGW
ncbi:hypothetical protein T484DRAFT_1846056 [Baffinella frigidus]|nr:hypothetical protein T484DRAFT_1846056 [Cryptophyta sp. CCMP2293]